ncbi:MAG: alkaline phosphatase family protein [Acidimicrobiales bacterium]
MLTSPATPRPTLPAYGGPSLDSVVPALMAAPGRRPDWVPEPAAGAAQVVLLVLDGLGWGQLQARRHLAPTLAAMAGGPITSVAPTTTATALTSIVTGSTPAEHGVVGYRVRVRGPTGDEVLNVLRWKTASGDARGFVPPSGFARRQPFCGRPVPVVSRASFAGSGFSVAHLSGSRDVAYHLLSGMAVEIRRLLREGQPFTYAYYEGIDKVAHISGFGEHYDAELVAADRLVADLAGLLGPGAALVVTGDHGQVEVGDRLSSLDPAVLDAAALVSGEARFRWLHAKPGRASELLDSAASAYGHEAWVAPADDLEAHGWFGGPLGSDVRHRLGDVAVVPHQPVGYADPADTGDARLVCRHGSMTDDEVLVPFVALAV